jgi:hypothetical protein
LSAYYFNESIIHDCLVKMQSSEKIDTMML